MKSSGRIISAGIEFQPDLQKPRRPVRLGVLLVTDSGDGVLLGRQPRLDLRPPEFEDVGQVTLELAANWVNSMWKDFLEDEGVDPLARLTERWRWNLYLVRPVRIARTAEKKDLLALGQQQYRKFVGEPFRTTVPRRRRHQARARRRHQHKTGLPSSVPMAWLVSEIMKRTSNTVIAA